MNIGQNILTNINEKASIDWNNYLTKDEVNKFLSKDDKVESAEEIIRNTKGNFFQKYWDQFKNDWTKDELVHDLANFYYNDHLINESKEFDLWKSQIDNKNNEELGLYLEKLYDKYRRFDDSKDSNIPPKKYQELMKKINYIENKLGHTRKIGRTLN